jgi:SagB-type dehydrogenase family enzyme
MNGDKERIGEQFQQETKYTRLSWRAERPVAPGKKPPEQKNTIHLPSLDLRKGPNLWETLRQRRSVRDYARTFLSLQDLVNLLWATQGTTAPAAFPWYRTAPSAGALHPIDTYLVVNRVQGLKPGIYFLHVENFSLELKREGDFSREIAGAALGQEMATEAAVVFVWVAVIRRSSQKYRQRAYRYIYLDCGHIGQNLYLAATAMNLGCCGVAAFFDDEVNGLVEVDGREETAIYLATVGKK